MTQEANTNNCPEGQLSWFQINNWVPIITSAVIIALSWGALNSKVDLINQKLDTYIANQDKIIQQLANGREINAKDIAQLKIDVNTLKVQFNKGD